MNAIKCQERILRHFDKIRVLTVDLLENFSVRKFQDTLNERAMIISVIKNEIEAQKESSDALNINKFNEDVDSYLREIRVMDIKVMSVIQSKMDEIRHELKGLSISAPAALAYSCHKRI